MTSNLTSFDGVTDGLIVDVGSVLFPQYQELKESAVKLSKNLQSVEVTADNIKESKKLVAQVSKRVKDLNDERIRVKKKMLEPYNEFENQVKEISQIVKSSEDLIRRQVRELEEQEREEKRQELDKIFQMRIKHYSFADLFTSESFIKPQHLNKTVSVEKVEKEMIQWLEKTKKEVSYIETLKYKDEILAEYKLSQDAIAATELVNRRHQEIEEIKDRVKVLDRKESTWIYTVHSEKDATLLEMFMNQNKIKYEKVEK